MAPLDVKGRIYLYGVFPRGKGICCLLKIHILVSVTLLIKRCLPQLLFLADLPG